MLRLRSGSADTPPQRTRRTPLQRLQPENGKPTLHTLRSAEAERVPDTRRATLLPTLLEEGPT